MKKIFFIIVANFSFLHTFAAAPGIDCEWLPGCSSSASKTVESATWFISTFIAQFIQYIAAIAVIALMISGLLYLISWWDDEKAKRAKKSIIWSLVWVFISISAWAIIGVVNTFRISWSWSSTTVNSCWNNLIDLTEQCDDGNSLSGDGCSSSCFNE